MQSLIVSSITSLDPDDWNLLVADSNFFQSYGWLAALDYALGNKGILAVKDSESLLAGCPFWYGEQNPGLFYLPDFFPSVCSPWDQKFLWVGSHRSTHNEVPCISGPNRVSTLNKLLYSTITLATEQDCVGIVIPYMPLSNALKLKSINNNAIVLMHSAEAYLDVPVGGLSEAMSDWSSHNRVQAKAEIAKFEQKGGYVEWHSLSGEIEDVAARLITQNRSKYGGIQDEEWMKHIFSGQQKSGIMHSGIVAVAKRNDQILGLTVFYAYGQSLHARYFGSNYAINDKDFRYFVLTYYKSLDYAAQHGFKKICLSISALEAKTKRGATLNPLAAVMMLVKPHSLDSDAVKRHNAEFSNQFHQRFSNYLSSEWDLLNNNA